MHGPSTEVLLAQTRWLQRLARDLVGDADEAAEVAQDAMLAALRQPAGAMRRPRAWLAVVVRNLARRRARRARQRVAVERAVSRPEAVPSAAEVVEKALLHRRAVDAVVALPEPYRSTLLMRYLEGCSLREVARRMDVPLETVRARQRRALARVRARLDAAHGGREAWAAALMAGTAAARLGAGSLVLMGMKTKVSAAVVLLSAAALLWHLETGAPPRGAPTSMRTPPAAGDPVAAALPRADAPAPPARAALAERGLVAEGAAPRAVVTGTVVDEETRAPIAGALVRWQPRRPLAPDAPALDENARTDAGGRFSLATRVPVAHEQLALLASAPGRAVVGRELGSPNDDGAPVRYEVGEITLPPGTGVTGRVRDADGKPVADAALVVAPHRIFTIVGGRGVPVLQLYRVLEAGRSSADGSFALAERLVGRPPFAPVLLAVSERGLGWAELDLERARTERETDVSLRPSAALDVRVLDADGAPVADVDVVAEPRFLPLGADHGADVWLPRGGALRAFFTRRTDASGTARFGALPLLDEARYTVRVERRGERVARSDGGALDASRVTEVTVRLDPAATLSFRGHVRDPDGRPIAGAAVVARCGAEQRAQTDGGGSYVLAALAAKAEHWSVTAHAPGCTRVTRSDRVRPGESAHDVDFVLEPAQPLFGTVVDQRGEPVAGATIAVLAADLRAQTDARGRFRLEDVSAGRTHALWLGPPQPSSDWDRPPTHVAAPSMSPLTLVLQRLPAGTATLHADLVGADGRPLEPDRVVLERLGADPEPLYHPATGAIGTVDASDLRPGSWRLRVRPTRGHPLEARFEVAPGETEKRLRLVQQPAGELEGVVVLDDLDAAVSQPATLRLRFAAAGQQPRWADVPGQPYAARDASSVTLDVGRGLLRFAVADVDPARALVLEIDDDALAARACVQVGSGERARLELRAQACAYLLLRSGEPWPWDELTLSMQRAGAPPDEPLRFAGLAGRRELLRWPMAPGELRWRVSFPTTGATNAKPPGARAGTITLLSGETTVVSIDPL